MATVLNKLRNRKSYYADFQKKLKALEASEYRYKQLFEHMSSGVAIYEAVDGGEDFVFKDFNRAAEKIENIKRENVIGKRVTEAFPGVIDFGLFDVFKRVYQTGESEYFPIRLYQDERIIGWRENYVYKLPCGNIVAIYDDRTKRKYYERALKESIEKTQEALVQSIEAFGVAIEQRDPFTAGHQKRVAVLAKTMAEMMGLSEEQIKSVYLSALIHDVGKLYIPLEILNRPEPLQKSETELVQGHPKAGYDILSHIDFPYPLGQVVLQHHERHDGSGYPNGLKGDEICIEAQILAVADVVEAMLSDRPYRKALKQEKALRQLVKDRGVLFNPKVVDACVRLFQEKHFSFDGAE